MDNEEKMAPTMVPPGHEKSKDWNPRETLMRDGNCSPTEFLSRTLDGDISDQPVIAYEMGPGHNSVQNWIRMLHTVAPKLDWRIEREGFVERFYAGEELKAIVSRVPYEAEGVLRMFFPNSLGIRPNFVPEGWLCNFIGDQPLVIWPGLSEEMMTAYYGRIEGTNPGATKKIPYVEIDSVPLHRSMKEAGK